MDVGNFSVSIFPATFTNWTNNDKSFIKLGQTKVDMMKLFTHSPPWQDRSTKYGGGYVHVLVGNEVEKKNKDN